METTNSFHFKNSSSKFYYLDSSSYLLPTDSPTLSKRQNIYLLINSIVNETARSFPPLMMKQAEFSSSIHKKIGFSFSRL
jgi:hypothetical protein